MTAFMCEECAKKMEVLFDVLEVPNSRLKKICPLCFTAGEGSVYDLEKIKRPEETEDNGTGEIDTRDLDELYGRIV